MRTEEDYLPFCIALTCLTSNSKADATCSTLNPKANKRGTASNALFSLNDPKFAQGNYFISIINGNKASVELKGVLGP